MQALSNAELIKRAPSIGAVAPMNTVSEKYSFVPTLKAVDILRECGWFPIRADEAGVRKEEKKGFQKHLIRFQHQNALGGNQERLDLLLFNSHDRGCAFNLIASVLRFVCSNGLVIGDECMNFKHRHVNFDADAMANSAFAIANQSAEIVDHVENLKAIELTPNEKGIFALAAHELVYAEPKKAPVQPEKLLTPKRSSDDQNDLWTTFNTVQENVMKGGLSGITVNKKGQTRRVKTRPVKSIDRNLKLNKALWILTEKMEELKS